MTMLTGKWLHFCTDDDHFITGEIVGMIGESLCVVRPVHLDGDDEGEPAHTIIASAFEIAEGTGRIFDDEAALRKWWAWLFRPETLSEARKRLRGPNG